MGQGESRNNNNGKQHRQVKIKEEKPPKTGERRRSYLHLGRRPSAKSGPEEQSKLFSPKISDEGKSMYLASVTVTHSHSGLSAEFSNSGSGSKPPDFKPVDEPKKDPSHQKRRRSNKTTKIKHKIPNEELKKAAEDKLTYRRAPMNKKSSPSILDVIKFHTKNLPIRNSTKAMDDFNGFSEIRIMRVSNAAEEAKKRRLTEDVFTRKCYVEVLRRIGYIIIKMPRNVVLTLKCVPNEAQAEPVPPAQEGSYEDLGKTNQNKTEDVEAKELHNYHESVYKLARVDYGMAAFEAINELAKTVDDLPACFLAPFYMLPEKPDGLSAEDIEEIEGTYLDVSHVTSGVPSFFHPKRGIRLITWKDVVAMQRIEDRLREISNKKFNIPIDFGTEKTNADFRQFLRHVFENDHILFVPPNARMQDEGAAMLESRVDATPTISKAVTMETEDDYRLAEERAQLVVRFRTQLPQSIRSSAEKLKVDGKPPSDRRLHAITDKWRLRNPLKLIEWAAKAMDYIPASMFEPGFGPPMPRTSKTLYERTSGDLAAKQWKEIQELNKQFEILFNDRHE